MKIAALKQRLPFVTVFTTPLIPSRHIPPLGVPDLTDWMNPVLWKFFDIAPKMLHRRSLTAQKLARAIRSVLQTLSMKKKAEEIGAMMQREDGLTRAVELVEQYGKIDK